MSTADQAREPTMEEILASIRKIIADEDPSPPAAKPRSIDRDRAALEARIAAEPPFPAAAVQRQARPAAPLEAAPEDESPHQQAAAQNGDDVLELTDEFMVAEEPLAHEEERYNTRLDAKEPARHAGKLANLENGFRPSAAAQDPLESREPPAARLPGASSAWRGAAPGMPPGERSEREAGGRGQPEAKEGAAPRPAWSSRDYWSNRYQTGALGGRAKSPDFPAASGASGSRQAPASAFDSWDSGVQTPIPATGPRAPIPVYEDAHGRGGVREAESSPDPIEDLPGRDGVPEQETPVLDNAYASPETFAPDAAANPEPFQAMAEDLARTAISGLEDGELEQAGKVKFTAIDATLLTAMQSSLAGALAPSRFFPEASAHQGVEDPVPAQPEQEAGHLDGAMPMESELAADEWGSARSLGLDSSYAGIPAQSDAEEETHQPHPARAFSGEADTSSPPENAIKQDSRAGFRFKLNENRSSEQQGFFTMPAPDLPEPDLSAPMAAAVIPAGGAAWPAPLGPHGPLAGTESGKEKTLEDSVKELLRPMLAQWLNDHMPRILEGAVRDEIAARTARREADGEGSA